MTVLADTRATHLVNAPLASIDLPEWLFSLSDKAYRACSPAHIAGGTSRTDDGKRMSINVERIAGNTDLDLLLKQHRIVDVIVVGLLANTCIEGTSRFATELGYRVTLVRDATAAFSADRMHAAHELNAPTFAHAIVTTADVVAALQRSATVVA